MYNQEMNIYFNGTVGKMFLIAVCKASIIASTSVVSAPAPVVVKL